jgi:starch synthase (maltosyl-transferring)
LTAERLRGRATARAPRSSPDGRARASGRVAAKNLDEALRRRVVIEGVSPEVDEGRLPGKAVAGQDVAAEADIYADGTDAIAAVVMYRRSGEREWRETPMAPLGNDRWRGRFPAAEVGGYEFTIEAWIDHFETWRRDIIKRLDAGQKPDVEYLIGARLVKEAAARAGGRQAAQLLRRAERLASQAPAEARARAALDSRLVELMASYPDRSMATRYHRVLLVQAAPPKAGFSAWYEMFPRSIWRGAGKTEGEDSAQAAGRHGTFKDVEARLRYVAEMGFDVLYLPPIHPIGESFRKGKNNALQAGPGDPGSPWAIGSRWGGHKSIHPQLGTLEEFRRLVETARENYGIEVALDIAFQASPDHPYLKLHPQWFRRRPDGTIQYAENPPKKYQDILPFDFETGNWRALWEELKSVFEFWIEQGVRIFRVDNPHTKPFAFWEWVIGDISRRRPDVIFLAEAFTRPKVMYRLAKIGFTQSYTYFAWRFHKGELTGYLNELANPPVRDFFRPNFWPNTPDILTEQLQHGGRPAFVARLVLAATMSSNYGIYGPAFELMEHEPREPGSEEYLNSEKYEIKEWDVGRPGNLRELIARVNRIRRENPALHLTRNIRFHSVDNDQLICYSKQSDDGTNVIIVVANLDFRFRQSGWVDLPIADWGIEEDEEYQVHDLLGEARYNWRGRRNFVIVDPHVLPAHVFRLRRRKGAGWGFE